jgi:hypothetical protein
MKVSGFAYVYHYGWVRNPRFLTAKLASFEKLYTENDDRLTVKQDEQFDYSGASSLSLFGGTHPLVMQPRVDAMDWQFEFDTSKRNLPLKYRALEWIEKKTGKRLFEFRNYRLV